MSIIRLSDSLEVLHNFDTLVQQAHKLSEKGIIMKYDPSFYEEDYLDDEDEVSFQKISHKPPKRRQHDKQNIRSRQKEKQKARERTQQEGD